MNSIIFGLPFELQLKKKAKGIPVTGREGP
jgi:hypothetical protein